MQLSTEGHPLHTRSLTIIVTLGNDGAWHARGDIIDLRKCSFVPMFDDIQPAGIIHQMGIDLRLDPTTRRIESIDIEQPVVAVEPSKASRGECCRDPAETLQQMVGEAVGEEFSKRLSAVFGGPRGCSHLLTLFQLMGSALPRALELENARSQSGAARLPGERLFRRSAFLDGFEISSDTVGVGVQLADFFTQPHSDSEHPFGRLALQNDARAYAVVSRETLSIALLRAATRERTGEALGEAQWDVHDAEVAPLVGSPLMGGLAARLLRQYGDRAERRLLLDCLLQLAPGYIQVMATLMEKWFQASPGTKPHSAGEPSVAAVGGTVDSCYIWRAGGPMAAGRPDFSGPEHSADFKPGIDD